MMQQHSINTTNHDSSSHHVDPNDDEEGTLGGGVANPLQPSAAYLESLRRARASERGNDVEEGYVRVAGKFTWAAAVFLFVGGWVLFILGAVYYWNSADFSTLKGITQAQGLDMLVCGSVMLLPGTYAVVGLVGAWRRWRGFSFDAMPLFDYTLQKR